VDRAIKLHQVFFQLRDVYCPHFILETNISVIRQVFISSFSVVSKSSPGRCWDATLKSYVCYSFNHIITPLDSDLSISVALVKCHLNCLAQDVL